MLNTNLANQDQLSQFLQTHEIDEIEEKSGFFGSSKEVQLKTNDKTFTCSKKVFEEFIKNFEQDNENVNLSDTNQKDKIIKLQNHIQNSKIKDDRTLTRNWANCDLQNITESFKKFVNQKCNQFKAFETDQKNHAISIGNIKNKLGIDLTISSQLDVSQANSLSTAIQGDQGIPKVTDWYIKETPRLQEASDQLKTKLQSTQLTDQQQNAVLDEYQNAAEKVLENKKASLAMISDLEKQLGKLQGIENVSQMSTAGREYLGEVLDILNRQSDNPQAALGEVEKKEKPQLDENSEKTLTSIINNLKAKVQQLEENQAKNEAIQNQINALTSDFDQFLKTVAQTDPKQKLQQLQTRLGEIDQKINLKQESEVTTTLQSQKQEVISFMVEANNKIKSNELEAEKQRLQEAQAKEKELQDKIEEQRAETEAKNQLLQQTEKRKAEIDLMVIEVNNASDNEKMAKMSDLINKLQGELEQAGQKNAGLTNMLNAQIQSLQTQLEQLKKYTAALQGREAEEQKKFASATWGDLSEFEIPQPDVGSGQFTRKNIASSLNSITNHLRKVIKYRDNSAYRRDLIRQLQKTLVKNHFIASGEIPRSPDRFLHDLLDKTCAKVSWEKGIRNPGEKNSINQEVEQLKNTLKEAHDYNKRWPESVQSMLNALSTEVPADPGLFEQNKRHTFFAHLNGGSTNNIQQRDDNDPGVENTVSISGVVADPQNGENGEMKPFVFKQKKGEWTCELEKPSKSDPEVKEKTAWLVDITPILFHENHIENLDALPAHFLPLRRKDKSEADLNAFQCISITQGTDRSTLEVKKLNKNVLEDHRTPLEKLPTERGKFESHFEKDHGIEMSKKRDVVKEEEKKLADEDLVAQPERMEKEEAAATYISYSANMELRKKLLGKKTISVDENLQTTYDNYATQLSNSHQLTKKQIGDDSGKYIDDYCKTLEVFKGCWLDGPHNIENTRNGIETYKDKIERRCSNIAISRERIGAKLQEIATENKCKVGDLLKLCNDGKALSSLKTGQEKEQLFDLAAQFQQSLALHTQYSEITNKLAHLLDKLSQLPTTAQGDQWEKKSKEWNMEMHFCARHLNEVTQNAEDLNPVSENRTAVLAYQRKQNLLLRTDQIQSYVKAQNLATGYFDHPGKNQMLIKNAGTGSGKSEIVSPVAAGMLKAIQYQKDLKEAAKNKAFYEERKTEIPTEIAKKKREFNSLIQASFLLKPNSNKKQLRTEAEKLRKRRNTAGAEAIEKAIDLYDEIAELKKEQTTNPQQLQEAASIVEKEISRQRQVNKRECTEESFRDRDIKSVVIMGTRDVQEGLRKKVAGAKVPELRNPPLVLSFFDSPSLLQNSSGLKELYDKIQQQKGQGVISCSMHDRCMLETTVKTLVALKEELKKKEDKTAMLGEVEAHLDIAEKVHKELFGCVISDEWDGQLTAPDLKELETKTRQNRDELEKAYEAIDIDNSDSGYGLTFTSEELLTSQHSYMSEIGCNFRLSATNGPDDFRLALQKESKEIRDQKFDCDMETTDCRGLKRAHEATKVLVSENSKYGALKDIGSKKCIIVDSGNLFYDGKQALEQFLQNDFYKNLPENLKSETIINGAKESETKLKSIVFYRTEPGKEKETCILHPRVSQGKVINFDLEEGVNLDDKKKAGNRGEDYIYFLTKNEEVGIDVPQTPDHDVVVTGFLHKNEELQADGRGRLLETGQKLFRFLPQEQIPQKLATNLPGLGVAFSKENQQALTNIMTTVMAKLENSTVTVRSNFGALMGDKNSLVNATQKFWREVFGDLHSKIPDFVPESRIKNENLNEIISDLNRKYLDSISFREGPFKAEIEKKAAGRCAKFTLTGNANQKMRQKRDFQEDAQAELRRFINGKGGLKESYNEVVRFLQNHESLSKASPTELQQIENNAKKLQEIAQGYFKGETGFQNFLNQHDLKSKKGKFFFNQGMKIGPGRQVQFDPDTEKFLTLCKDLHFRMGTIGALQSHKEGLRQEIEQEQGVRSDLIRKRLEHLNIQQQELNKDIDEGLLNQEHQLPQELRGKIEEESKKIEGLPQSASKEKVIAKHQQTTIQQLKSFWRGEQHWTGMTETQRTERIDGEKGKKIEGQARVNAEKQKTAAVSKRSTVLTAPKRKALSARADGAKSGSTIRAKATSKQKTAQTKTKIPSSLNRSRVVKRREPANLKQKQVEERKQKIAQQKREALERKKKVEEEREQKLAKKKHEIAERREKVVAPRSSVAKGRVQRSPSNSRKPQNGPVQQQQRVAKPKVPMSSTTSTQSPFQQLKTNARSPVKKQEITEQKQPAKRSASVQQSRPQPRKNAGQNDEKKKLEAKIEEAQKNLLSTKDSLQQGNDLLLNSNDEWESLGLMDSQTSNSLDEGAFIQKQHQLTKTIQDLTVSVDKINNTFLNRAEEGQTLKFLEQLHARLKQEQPILNRSSQGQQVQNALNQLSDAAIKIDYRGSNETIQNTLNEIIKLCGEPLDDEYEDAQYDPSLSEGDDQTGIGLKEIKKEKIATLKETPQDVNDLEQRLNEKKGQLEKALSEAQQAAEQNKAEPKKNIAPKTSQKTRATTRQNNMDTNRKK